jgi:hypothetical protein
MRVENMVVTTTKETTNSIVQSANCMEKLGHVLVHMVEQMKNGWTCGYDDIWMNEKDKICRNLSLGLATKAKSLSRARAKKSVRRKIHTPK